MAHARQGESSNKLQGKTARGSRRQVEAPPSAPQHAPGRVETLQQTLGNQGVLRRMEAGLRINDVNDPSEREADRVAQAVMAPPNGTSPSAAVVAAPGAAVQRKCAACEEEDEKLQRKESSASVPVAAPPVVKQVLASPGEQMDAGTRSFMESRFGQDFSHVRIHTGDTAASATQSVNALAYTVGHDVVFGAGRYTPTTTEGRRLLAHELAHVVQQSRNGSSPALHDQNDPLEADADQAAASALQHNKRAEVHGHSAMRLARQTGPVQVPTTLSFLTADDIRKLQAFGDSDFQASLNTLQGHLRKTQGTTQAGNPQQYIDIRQAAGEVRTFLDYIRNPDVAAVKVVPSATGGRSPDLYIRRRDGTEFRAEIYNVTLASRSVRPELRTDLPGQPVRIPKVETEEGGTRVNLPTNEFDVTA
ncbi:MAG TPA: DUF4157 domain-containing protein, partial [Terriglobales bacterium]|nr:DUF4157 domain-containing protein [Terriglobales bacterium]